MIACGKLVLRAGARRVLAVGLLLAIILGSLSIPLRYWQATANYGAAEQSLAKGRFLQARDHLARYLDYEPNSPPGHFLMARVARRAGFLAEADVHLDVCDLLSGPTEESRLERHLANIQTGDLSGDELLWNEAKERPQHRAEIFRALSQGYRKNYLLEKMRRCLDAWLETEPVNAEALYRRGWVWERQGDYHAALDDYQRALTADSDFHDARLRKAQALLFLRRSVEALEDLETLRRIKPDDPEAGLALAQCWTALGRSRDAQKFLDDLTVANPLDFPLIFEQGRLALEQGRLDKAEGWLRRALARLPRDHKALYTLSLILSRQGKKHEAEQIRTRIEHVEADLERMTQLTDQLQKRPSDPDLRCAIGKLFLRSGEKQEAVLWLKSALRANPAHVPSHEALAQHYDAQNPGLALHHRRQAAARFPLRRPP